MRRSSNKGYSLIEILLVLGITSGVLLGVYGLYALTSNAFSKQHLYLQTEQTLDRVQKAYAAQANYADLTMQKAMSENLFAPTFTYQDGRVFSGTVEVTLYPIDNSEGINGGGFALKYIHVSSKECVNLSSNAFKLTSHITINNATLKRDTDGGLDMAQTVYQCNQSNDSEIVLSFLKTGAADSLQLCQAPTGDKTQQLACPQGQTGKLVQKQHAFCNQAYGNPQWTPWETTENTCQPCPSDETRVTQCPDGTQGSLSQKRSFNCSVGDWNPWVTVNNQCQPCPPDETRTTACPYPGFPEGFVVSQKRIYICDEKKWSDWITTEATCKSP